MIMKNKKIKYLMSSWAFLVLSTTCTVAVQAEAAPAPVDDSVTVHNGPIAFTASKEFFATKYHFNGNGDSTKPLEVKPVNGFITGSIGAARPGSVVNVDGTGAKIGFNDGIDNDLAHMSYTNMPGATRREEKAGDIHVIDPVSVVAINGGNINIKGDDMRYNVIYGYVNHGRNQGDPRSKISVELTGDLIGGDTNYPLGSRQEDYYKQAKPIHSGDKDSGGWFGVGTLDAYTLTDVSVKARSVTADNLIAGIGANLDVISKTSLTGKRMWASNFGKANLQGESIKLEKISVNNPLPTPLPWDSLKDTHTIVTIGDASTKSIDITDSSVVKGGQAELHLKGDRVSMGAWEFDGGSNGREDSEGETKLYYDSLARNHKMEQQLNADAFTVKAKSLKVNGNVHTGNITVDAKSDAMEWNSDSVAIWPKSTVTIAAKELKAKLGPVNVGRIIGPGIGDPTDGGDLPVDTVFSVHGDTGRLEAQDMDFSHASIQANIDGHMDISAHSIAAAGGTVSSWAHTKYSNTTVIKGKTIDISGTIPMSQGFSPDKYLKDGKSIFNKGANLSLEADESIHIAGSMYNGGTKAKDSVLAIKAPVIDAYRLQTNDLILPSNEEAFPHKSAERGAVASKSTTTVDGDTVTVHHSIAAFNPDNTLTITAKNLIVLGDKSRDDDSLDKGVKAKGYVWGSNGGTVNVNIKEGGHFIGSAEITPSFTDEVMNMPAFASAPWDTTVLPAVLNINLAKNSVWDVPHNSTISAVTSDGGTVHLLKGDTPSTFTTEAVKGDTTFVLNTGAAADSHDTVHVGNQDGHIGVAVVPDSTVKAETSFSKVPVLNVTTATKANDISAAKYQDPDQLFSWKAPIIVENNTAYLDGSFVLDKSAVNTALVNRAEQAIDGLTYGQALLVGPTAMPWNQSLGHKGLWATITRDQLSHDGVTSKGHTLTVGASHELSPNTEWGVGFSHSKLGAYGMTGRELSSSLGMAYVYHRLSPSKYVAGLVKGGSFHEARVLGATVQYGVRKQGLQTYVETSYGHLSPNGDYGLGNTASVHVDSQSLFLLGMGTQYDKALSRGFSFHAGLKGGHIFGNRLNYTIDDGLNQWSGKTKAADWYWNADLGLGYAPSKDIMAKLQVSTGESGQVRNTVQWGAELSHKF